MGLAPPTPVVESMMSQEEKKGGCSEIVEDRTAVDETSRKIFEVFAGIDVVKELGSRKTVPINHGDKSKKVMNEEKANRNHPCDDLAGSEGGGEAANRNEESAHEEKEEESTKEGSSGEDRGRVRQESEKVKLDEARNQEKEIETQGGRVFPEDKLPGLNRGSEEGFESSGTFFLCKKTHGDERKNGEEIEPEVACVEYMEDQALSGWGILKVLHR